MFVVTGATSFIGVRLARLLLEKGNRVVAVCRDRDRGRKLLGSHESLDIVPMQLADYGRLDTLLQQADVFVHLAWEGTGHEGRNDIAVQQANVGYAETSMRVARRLGCRLFVEAGSQAEYGSQSVLTDENAVCVPASAYGKAKLAVCRRGFELAEELGMKYLHLRIFSLFGEDDHPWTLVMSCVKRMLQNEPIDLSACTQSWNFLYIADAVSQIEQLCRYALDKDDFCHEIYNIASDDTRPLRSFVEEIKQLTGSESDLHYGAMGLNVVSLKPDVTKLRQAVGVVSPTAFCDAILRVINEMKRQ